MIRSFRDISTFWITGDYCHTTARHEKICCKTVSETFCTVFSPAPLLHYVHVGVKACGQKMAAFMRQRPIPTIPGLFYIYTDAAAQTIIVAKNPCHKRRHLVKENTKPNSLFKYCAQITYWCVSETEAIPLFLSNIFCKLLWTNSRVLQRILFWIVLRQGCLA